MISARVWKPAGVCAWLVLVPGFAAAQPAEPAQTTAPVAAEPSTTAPAEAAAAATTADAPATTTPAPATAPAAPATSPTLPQTPSRPSVHLPSGVYYEVLTPPTGDGPEVTTDAMALIHYRLTGDQGQEWDNSRTRPIPRPFKFNVGQGFVVRGMDEGVLGMKVGERRMVHVPPALGYGEAGTPGPDGIPPNAWLHFDVQLVGMKPPPPPGEGITTGTAGQETETLNTER